MIQHEEVSVLVAKQPSYSLVAAKREGPGQELRSGNSRKGKADVVHAVLK